MKFRNRAAIRLLPLLGIVLAMAAVFGCSTCCLSADLAAVDYTPKPGGDWEVSTPEARGVDPDLVAELYCKAAGLDTIYSLLIIKDGQLIAEDYFNDGGIDKKDRIQSVTKSFTSASVGIAIEEGLIDGVDQKMLDFYPEIAPAVSDPRKENITVKQLLQMRSGYPWEESSQVYWDGLLSGHYPSLIEEFPLETDPGTAFHYSNLSSNWLGIMVDRQSGMNLKAFLEEHLFTPLGIEPGEWGQDAEGHNNGCGDLHLNARDIAKFGLLYLDGGVYRGERIIPEAWVEDSLKVYSEEAWGYRVGPNFKDIGYGYQWWSIRAGEHRYNLAWGHGGQQIALMHDRNIVIVATSYPYWLEHNDKAWKHEKQMLNLVADFVAKLPAE